MKIIFRFIIYILLSSLFFCTGDMHAAKKAVFPDSRTLQPAPANISPNFSGNINSQENGEVLNIQKKEDTSGYGASHDSPGANNVEPQQKNAIWLIIFLMAGFVAFLYLKPKKRK